MAALATRRFEETSPYGGAIRTLLRITISPPFLAPRREGQFSLPLILIMIQITSVVWRHSFEMRLGLFAPLQRALDLDLGMCRRTGFVTGEPFLSHLVRCRRNLHDLRKHVDSTGAPSLEFLLYQK